MLIRTTNGKIVAELNSVYREWLTNANGDRLDMQFQFTRKLGPAYKVDAWYQCGINIGDRLALDPASLAVEAACLAILIASPALSARSAALGSNPPRRPGRRTRSPVGQEP